MAEVIYKNDEEKTLKETQDYTYKKCLKLILERLCEKKYITKKQLDKISKAIDDYEK